MRRSAFTLATALLAILLFGCRQSQPTDPDSVLSGTAEDLWGSRIDLSAYDDGITLIEPFSPSYCGYCMLVGEFVDLNYFRVNAERGGDNFQQCVFSPQIDIYTYQKFYRDTGTVLTYPVSLHRWHRDGYPSILAFRDGRQILNANLEDYGESFKQRAAAWWPDLDTPGVALASGMKMAETYTGEVRDRMVITVLPDGDTERYEAYEQRFRDQTGVALRRENQLSTEDLRQNLEFSGKSVDFGFDLLRDQPLPFHFDSLNLHLGPYTFPRDQYAFRAIAPNPYNPEKYLTFAMTTPRCNLSGWQSWTDFLVSRIDSSGTRIIPVLDGRFAKGPDNVWRFADSLSTAYENLGTLCTGGVCPAPSSRQYATLPYTLKSSSWENATGGRALLLGSAQCRFPTVATASDGTTGVVWEERGDIILALLKEGVATKSFLVENGAADAYNPRIVWDGRSYLIAYLANRDGWYRLCVRYLDGDNLSDEIRLTAPGSFDDVTPALASDGAGRVYAAWTEWKANRRCPRYCLISQRAAGPIQDIPVVPDGAHLGDYANAWYISLAVGRSGRPVGFWNQHYPATLCVCGGPLDGPVSTPQKLTGNVETSECGEYASTSLDPQENQWAVWATFSADLFTEAPQRILASRFDSASGAWTAPYTVSRSGQTFQNQTPQLVIGPDGAMTVVYSGRASDPASQWGIYMSRFENGGWTEPRLISTPGVCARAPQAALTPNGKLWAVWHEGIGDGMTVRVWQEL